MTHKLLERCFWFLDRTANARNLHPDDQALLDDVRAHLAHCDEDGYGPANLVRRLEHGYPEQYGYNAETVVRLVAENEQLRKDAERYRWLAEYLVSDDEFYDDAIVAATTVKEVDSVIDNAMKGTP